MQVDSGTETCDTCAAVGLRVCSKIAWRMHERFTPFLPHADFDQLAEEFLEELGAPVSLIDHLQNTRLFEVEIDGVSFVHDLLLHHLAAAELVRQARRGGTSLAVVARQPHHRALLAELLARVPDPALAVNLALKEGGRNILEGAYRGELGLAVKDILNRRIAEVLDACEEEIPDLELECIPSEKRGGYRCIRGIGLKPMSPDERTLLSLAVEHPEDWLPRFAQLLNAYAVTVHPKLEQVARAHRLKLAYVTECFLLWEEVWPQDQNRCPFLVHEVWCWRLSQNKLTKEQADHVGLRPRRPMVVGVS